ncbi:NADPH-dependent FMN reductase [Liquorilactobacillus aquaticus DSM 21051]|uniref:NADPH-dependent FMN reductase n=1 Tax=Liquorilactobacillus aquaticus DSM 21051 TaxID=1423725 RepID=A0A0R2D6R1_9LACO|nr:NAD(P)H-dependent oxidoreductase [Liquorilactobacillus aquaticus]KRM96102.1 NADPH-dependent FMN reductase [Liquorilactobacillus aquaticus DSM 21051]
MKLVAIVGTNAAFSYNRILLHYMQQHFEKIAEIEVCEINELPPFCEDLPVKKESKIMELAYKITKADGVVFACPEYDHSIPAPLKSAIEWLSYEIDPLKQKPVLIVGASYGPQGSSRAQQHLRQILASPDANANVLPGNEFLLGNVAQVFDKEGQLGDQQAIKQLNSCFNEFLSYIRILQADAREDKSFNSVKNPFFSDATVQFPTGKLKLLEIQQLLSTLPFELDFIDADDEFAWFSDKAQREHVRSVDDLGEPVKDCHPPQAVPAVLKILSDFRSGAKDRVERCFIAQGHPIYTQYLAVRDSSNKYLGTLEITSNVEHLKNLLETGAFSSEAGSVKAASQSTKESKENEADAVTGASQHDGSWDDTSSSGSMHG